MIGHQTDEKYLPKSRRSVSISIVLTHSLGVATVCPLMTGVIFPPEHLPRGCHALQGKTSSSYAYSNNVGT